MNVPYYLTIDKGLVHFGSEVRKVSYSVSQAVNRVEVNNLCYKCLGNY